MWNTLMLLLMISWPVPEANTRPAQFQWENRLIIVFESADEALTSRQLKLFEGKEESLEDRDLKLFKIPQGSHPWRKRYNLTDDQFALLLVGKDGGVKRRVQEPISPDLLFQQIDQMPMRRREMREE